MSGASFYSLGETTYCWGSFFVEMMSVAFVAYDLNSETDILEKLNWIGNQPIRGFMPDAGDLKQPQKPT